MKAMINVGDRVSVAGKEVLCNEDQTGTVIVVFSSTVKVQLDNGSKWYVSIYFCSPHIDHL